MEKIIFHTLKPRVTNSLVIKRTFFEPPRAGYPVIYDKSSKNLSVLERLRKACSEFKGECKLFIKEIQHSRLYPPIIVADKTDIIWKFDKAQKSLDQWIVNCDGDYHHGFSTAKLELSTYGTGIFHGVLDTRVPKDGITTDSGYCNITTVPKLKSFRREDIYDWANYNELVLRIRGDGRCYMLNILQQQMSGVTQYLGFHYFMYTRGGPYWQIVRIPFAKFLAGMRAEIYENQFPMIPQYIKDFGITIADKKSGPFRLEIDYIGICNNSNLFETFAYETHEGFRNR